MARQRKRTPNPPSAAGRSQSGCHIGGPWWPAVTLGGTSRTLDSDRVFGRGESSDRDERMEETERIAVPELIDAAGLTENIECLL
jgi:hypothetical protein